MYVRRLTVPRLIAGKLKVGFVFLVLGGVALLPSTRAARGDEPWVVYNGHEGPGKGKKIVFVSGDEEYRSEEGLLQLAKILAARHGFHCTVLFAIDPKDGTINPNQSNNIPGLEALDSADLMVILTRFRDLPDDQMRQIVDYVESGRPIVALPHGHACLRHQTPQNVRSLRLAEQGMGRRFRPARAGRDLDQPPRPSRTAEHARAHRPGNARTPHSPRHS